MTYPLKILRARPADHAVNLVALLEQQLGQIGPVLSGNPGNKGFCGHGDSSSITANVRAAILGVRRGSVNRSLAHGQPKRQKRELDWSLHVAAQTPLKTGVVDVRLRRVAGVERSEPPVCGKSVATSAER